MIKDSCDVFNGVKPFEKGKGMPAQTAKTMKEKPFVAEHQTKPEGEHWLPLMRGRLMNRYVSYWNNDSWIDYGEWLAAPRNPALFEVEEKIIVRQTGDSIIATLIGKNIIARDNLHLLLPKNSDLKFVLGILNSKLTDFIYYQINPEKGEVLAQVKKGHIEQLLIPVITKETEFSQEQISDSVAQLLQLNQEKIETKLQSKIDQLNRRIDFLENKINQIIYQLYDLTDEEIKIVERK